jgi:two-component system, NtrC family, response regulator HydG
MERKTILVVDDFADTLELLRRNLESHSYIVFTAATVPDAINILEDTPVDLVITDLKMPHYSGLDLIRHVRDNYKKTEVMMITGYATIAGAVEAIKTGATEFLSKPFTDDELYLAVSKALVKLKNKGKLMDEAPETLNFFEKYGIFGNSDPMKKVFRMINKVASTNANILITGESGSGKELVARAIHYSSYRSRSPFVPVNCGGIPRNLLERELFWFVKGAFTGAYETRSGFFQTADGGTIFLDEISETSPAMQVKLLRVLQDKEVCMIGTNKTVRVDVRIIAASNKDLELLVQKGKFREDLFYRLNVLNIFIPPLRERGEDLIALIDYFAKKYAEEFKSDDLKFSEKAIETLKNYYWPGNVRELENLIQRLVVMADNEIIDVPDLPAFMRYSISKDQGFTRPLAEVESEYIKNVLASVEGNKTHAAEILGIDRKTLREKLK